MTVRSAQRWLPMKSQHVVPRRRAPRCRRRIHHGAVAWLGRCVLAEVECEDRNTELVQRLGLSCEEAARLQVCRNTQAQRLCVDDDESLRAYMAQAANCSEAASLGGCASSPVVARWCPHACGSCPTTPQRDELVRTTRQLCRATCSLCAGETAHDCLGAFGSWSQCGPGCRRVRRFAITRPVASGGRQCTHADGEEEFAECCGLGTRWRVVAASTLPGAWQVRRLRFYEKRGQSGASSSGPCTGAPVVVKSPTGVRPGQAHDTLVSGQSALQEDPALVQTTACLGCCTLDGVGPIASGSMPAPYGCENAVMLQQSSETAAAIGAGTNTTWWRSSCNPCKEEQAWLGFRTDGVEVDVRCVEFDQIARDPTTGFEARGPSKLRLERWNGERWEVRGAMSVGTASNHVTIRTEEPLQSTEAFAIPRLILFAVGAFAGALVLSVVVLLLLLQRRAAIEATTKEEAEENGKGAADASPDEEDVETSERSRLLALKVA